MAGDMYLENLDEFIFDEDRIVTYKWLSQTLSVHVNQAKQMLETFVKRQQLKPNSRAVNVIYLLSGVHDSDNGVKVNKVVLVSDKDVQKTEEAMTQLFSKHVYSVQKATLKDSNSLYMTDYQITKENIKQPNRYSAITCPEAKPRTSEELDVLLSQSSYPTSDTNSRPKPKMNGTAEKHVIESLKQEPPPKGTASKATKKGQITSFGGFSSGTSKGSSERLKEKEVASSSRQKELESTHTKQTSSKAKGGMMAFLNRPSVKPKQEPRASPPKQSTTKDARKTQTESRNSSKVKRKAAKIDVSDSDSEGERQSSKRRRRIIQQVSSSSSSSEEEVSDMEDSPIPPTPPPEPVHTVESESEEEVSKVSSHKPSVAEECAPGSSGKRRRKKRVMRNKTTIDDDGCMVTEKVWESDWTDVSEDEAPPTKKAAPPETSQQSKAKAQVEEEGKKKKTSPGSGGSGKTKQRSLMSFFQKK